MANAANTAGSQRALDAALAGPAFSPRGVAGVERFSGGVADRLAPEFAEGGRGLGRGLGSMRSLAFADRLIAPVLNGMAADDAGGLSQRRGAPSVIEGAATSMNWLFPRPWYLDELAWLRASMQGGEGGAPRSAGATAQSRGVAPRLGLPTSMGFVAPSFASAVGGRPAAAAAFSTTVPFEAVRAAELMAAAFAPKSVGPFGDDDATRTSMAAPLMDVLSSPAFADPSAEAPRSAAHQRLERVVAQLSERREKMATAAATIAQMPTSTATAPEKPRHAAATASASPAELLARGALAGQLPSPSAGPRIVMPAGLGALVTNSLSPAHAGVMSAPAPGAQTQAVSPTVSRDANLRAALSGFARSYVAAAPVAESSIDPLALASGATFTTRPSPAAGTESFPRRASGLDAMAAQTPRALGHVAWSDRWLGRFAGASAPTLRTLDAFAMADDERRAAFAPSEVFVSLPSATDERAASTRRGAYRIDDGASVPDDVFAAISRAAAGPRTPKAVAAAQTHAAARAEFVAAAPRPAPADVALSQVLPHSGAGLGPSLGASPAAGLVAGMTSSVAPRVFDVRALVPEALLAGAGWSDELTASQSQSQPQSQAQAQAQSRGVAAGRQPRSLGGLMAASFMAPREINATSVWLDRLAAEAPDIVQLIMPARTAQNANDGEAHGGQRRFASTPANAVPVRGGAEGAGRGAAATPSWSPAAVQFMSNAAPDAMASASAATASMQPAFTGSGRPGALGAAASGFAIDREMASTDLALDFVEPELVAMARNYGLAPAHAVDAGRFAAQGEGAIASRAGAVDLTFLTALQSRAAEASESAARQTNAASAPGRVAPKGTPTATQRLATADTASASAGVDIDRGSTAADAGLPPRERLGLGARLPRGAYMYPQASLQALGVDTGESRPIDRAAFDLVAAGVVAEMGALVALMGAGSRRGSGEAQVAGQTAGADATSPGSQSLTAARGRGPGGIVDGTGMFAQEGSVPGFEALYVALSSSSVGQSMSPSVRAARAFALASQAKASGTSDMTSARARALVAWSVMPMVLTGETQASSQGASPGTASRGGLAVGDAPSMVHLAGSMSAGAAQGAATDAGTRLQLERASRAGSALASLVAPEVLSSGGGSASAMAPPYSGAIHRVPTAAPELIRTGPSATSIEARAARARAEGNTQLPAWFESAAKKLFETKTGSDELSLSDLTLVNVAPPDQIAASPKTAEARTASSVPDMSSKSGESEKPTAADVEQMARDVYEELTRMIEIARMRNGDPWQ